MQAEAVGGTVLYDDSCGFCRRWIPFWAKVLNRHHFDIATLQSPWTRAQLDLNEDVLADLRLLLPDGGQIQGADVYRHVMRRIWWAYPLYMLAILPVLRELFDWSYRTFARNRYRFSATCGMPNTRAGGAWRD
jgi:predicted DCC family thiol-disulfide oxidoreductase YuxK